MTETYTFRQGGLMRCCLATLDNEMVRRQQTDQPLMAEGDTLRCKYCSDEYGMICATNNKGVLGWQWAKSALKQES